MAFLFLIIGLAILIGSGELLVKGAVNVAFKLRLTPLVVGMTVVSFGTSAPELLVSIQSALSNHPEIAIGNVVGSNVANLALVLGLTVLIFPMKVERNTLIYDWPMMMIATGLLYFAIQNQNIEWYEGLGLFAGLIGFIFFIISKSRKGAEETEFHVQQTDAVWIKDVLLIITGCMGLAVGSKLLLDGAVSLAKDLGLSEHVIGVTIVAFGTSVPELVTSCVAAFKKQSDISVGNLIGSNIFNIMAILGITSMIREIPISFHVLNTDIYWVIGVSLLLLPYMLVGRKINRFAGSVLLGSYLIYIAYQLI